MQLSILIEREAPNTAETSSQKHDYKNWSEIRHLNGIHNFAANKIYFTQIKHAISVRFEVIIYTRTASCFQRSLFSALTYAFYLHLSIIIKFLFWCLPYGYCKNLHLLQKSIKNLQMTPDQLRDCFKNLSDRSSEIPLSN